jgi:hypothetical protein
VDWNSPPGDIKRAAKFAVKSTNYNASMTSIDVHGFLDLNDIIFARKPNGTAIRTFTGRECLVNFFKFQDSSSLIAEVHQHVPLGPASLIYPNTPEGEKLITSLAKQPAAFAIGHLGDQQIDQTFINDFLKTFIDPQLIHEASQCEWDSESQTLLTPSELAEDTATGDLEEQGWWKDVVLQYDNDKGKGGKRSYAAQNALFDLDGAQSIKTMHQAHDMASTDNSTTPSKRVRISNHKSKNSNNASDGSESSPGSLEGRGSRRQGHTPRSVEVREDGLDPDMESVADDKQSVSSQEATSTASDADQGQHFPGTSG